MSENDRVIYALKDRINCWGIIDQIAITPAIAMWEL